MHILRTRPARPPSPFRASRSSNRHLPENRSCNAPQIPPLLPHVVRGSSCCFEEEFRKTHVCDDQPRTSDNRPQNRSWYAGRETGRKRAQRTTEHHHGRDVRTPARERSARTNINRCRDDRHDEPARNAPSDEQDTGERENKRQHSSNRAEVCAHPPARENPNQKFSTKAFIKLYKGSACLRNPCAKRSRSGSR